MTTDTTDTAVVVHHAPPPPGLMSGGLTPAESLAAGQDAAAVLWKFAQAGNAVLTLQGRQYLKIEGWVFLGRAFGLTARIVRVDRLPGEPETWQAEAHVLDAQGNVVGSGIGQCGRDERTWAKRDGYALSGMAQTRAASRALRGILSWVAVLAGVEATPAEEIPPDTRNAAPGRASSPRGHDNAATYTNTPPPAADAATDKQRRALFALTADLGSDNAARVELFNSHLAEPDRIADAAALGTINKRVAGLLISALSQKATADDLDRLKGRGAPTWGLLQLMEAVHAGLTALGYKQMPPEPEDLTRRQVDLLCAWFDADEGLRTGRTPMAYPEGTTSENVYPEEKPY